VLVASDGSNTEMKNGPVPSRQCWASTGNTELGQREFYCIVSVLSVTARPV